MTSQPKDNEHTRSSLELMYHISRELTTALDLATVLERVLVLSMRTVGAISGSLIVVDDTGKPVESAIITGEQIHSHTTNRLKATLDRGLAGWVARHREGALVTDTSQDERWMLREYEREEKSEPKSAVSAPLLVRDRLTGVMTLVHPKAGFFTQDHLALVQAISDQASIAVLNARLYAESQRQARVMTALAETAATITASLNLEDVLSRILDQIGQALAVQVVVLSLIEQGSDTLVTRATSGWSTKNPAALSRKIGQGIAGWVAKEGRGLVIPNAPNDTRYDPDSDERPGIEMKSLACAPLRYRGQIIGVLEAINPVGETFDQEALLVLTGIGSLAGTAVRHAQLFERLQAAHQSYRELFEDSIDLILITDWAGAVIEANRQAATWSDFPKDILLSMNIRQLHAIDMEQTGSSFEHLKSHQTFSYESRLRTRSGHEMPIQVYVREVMIEDVSHLQWIIRDITERKNLDSMREDLLSMIYHDLRSPLHNVVSSLDTLDTLMDDDPELKAFLNIATRATKRIQRLTDSLLDINRLEAGQTIGARHPTNPGELINEATELVQPVVEGKQQSLNKSTQPNLPNVLVDAEMIRRVIINLLENAVKYTPAGSKIEIGAQVRDNWVEIWVQDNGPGIPASEHERVFAKFTRLGMRDTPKAKGLGLGLAYCKLAVQGHGGRIWVESEPGAGARFIFTLPLDSPEAASRL